jgi:hypothetical protein
VKKIRWKMNVCTKTLEKTSIKTTKAKVTILKERDILKPLTAAFVKDPAFWDLTLCL